MLSVNSGRRLLHAIVLAAVGVLPVQAEELLVSAGYSEIVFDTRAAVPVRWTICATQCADSQHKAVLFAEDDGYFHITTPAGSAGDFSAAVQELADEVVVNFRGAHGNYIYRLSRAEARVQVKLPSQASIEFATGDVFVPEQLPGFGQIYSRVNAVLVSEAGQNIYEQPEDLPAELTTTDAAWTGVRSRYWTLLARTDGEALVPFRLPAPDHPVVQLTASDPDAAAQFEFYAGPVEWRTLKQIAPELSEMLFAALWDFLRLLCFGMLILLEWLQTAVGSFGLAIVLLSLSNKILMSPLTMLADRWQAEVNRQHSLLKPELDEIRQSYKGEEAHKRVLEVYEKHGVSQFYTFKSAAGFLIQIPVFIAAFDMLAENIALNEIAFLWVADLAKPDHVLELPFVLPFFGGWLNLLPFLMTALSVLAAWLQAEDTLTAELQRQQSIRLYLMSAAFFMLFYTFPAGMVLYWTSSNLFHLLKVESGRLFARL